jgi:hypothetical protein
MPTKREAKGYQETRVGYRLHIDTADGEIPITCVLTAASVHDSQVAIPLASRFASLAGQRSGTLGVRQPIARGANETLVGHRMAEDVRYGERSTAERVNGGLKDNHGGRNVRVRRPEKVMCHLMFGVLSFTVLQLLRLIS